MRLPKDMLSNTYTKPRIFLCETDKTRICQLNTTNTRGTFKFNAYSEINFEVARTYNDLITGQAKVNPYYDRIENPRLIYLEKFGYFEIQGPDLSADGIKEFKTITAYSLEHTLSQKYLEDFYTANGRDEWYGSLEDLWQVKTGDYETVPKIVLYNPEDPNASVLDLILEKVYGWKIGHIDSSLWTLSRSFDVDRQSIYDFIINEICAKFNCYAEFDTINNEINLYAESPSEIFIADGISNTFILTSPFSQVDTVSVDGYKTTRWEYNLSVNEDGEIVGVLTLEDTPRTNAYVEAVGNMLQKWETDVFISFNNLSNEINISYDAESIKTVLTVTYGDDGNIREVNLGLPYLVDISYYYTLEWMGQDLYDAYTAYLQKADQYQADFTDNTQQRLKLAGYQEYHESRFGLDYDVVPDVTSGTVGSFYVRGGDAPDYYYTEVSLPAEYKAGTTYYKLAISNLNEDKVENLYTIFQQYFNGNEDWETNIDKLSRDFEFMKSPSLDDLKANLKAATTQDEQDEAILEFLQVMWNELGKTNLNELYLTAYKTRQTVNMSMDDDEDAGTVAGNWSEPTHPNYWLYYPVTLMIESIETAIAERDKIIQEYQKQIDALSAVISATSDDLLIANNFTDEQLVRLSAFLREDELHLDDIVETDLDSLEVIYNTKQDAMESGRIELQKRCQPQLQFSMTMANIYALPEFEPIIDQFQLGNVIKVALRPDYVKQSRLLQVDINFDNLSDFSCEFGELTSLRTQSDIHADLLKQAVSAGKSVATNASYWTKGSNQATATDLKIEQGLLDAATQIKSTDGTQGVVIDKYGIRLQKDAGNGEIDPEQVWLVNNQIVFTDDNFKTSRSAIGKVTVDGKTYYGLISEIVLAGYIEGSKVVGSEIEGGIIQIGDLGNGKWAFEVKENGDVYMLGGDVKFTQGSNGEQGENTIADSLNVVVKDLENQQEQIDEIKNKQQYTIEIYADGPTAITSMEEETTLTCKVFSWDSDITDVLYDSQFNWIRSSNNPEKDAIWNALPKSQGTKSISIGVDDIDDSASFSCEVDLLD